MKKLEWGKYALIYLAGFLTSFSGALDSLVKIPSSYKELKKTYIYDSEFLTGQWSTNAEYLADSGELGLEPSQPKMTVSMKWFTEFGHLNRGDMLTSEQHRCHNEKKKFQRRV